MKLLNLDEIRAEREGIITPKVVITNLLDHIDEIEEVVVVVRRKDDVVIHGVSDMNATKAVGLYELGKFMVINNMWEEF